jgi:hypothetical protein
MVVRPTADDMDDDEPQQAPTPRRIDRTPARSRADTRGKRIANREVWLQMPAPYDNLKILAWLDYPQSIANQWVPIDGETNEERSERVMSACKQVFLEHDGWEDHEGELPPPGEDEFWERIPTQLGAAIIKRLQAELEGNGPSRASRGQRRSG